jgi:hypothetical protein
MARALPSANLGMIAFIGTFRFGCPALGLAWGTACGYALAAATLIVVGESARWAAPAAGLWVRFSRCPAALRVRLRSVSLRRASPTADARRPVILGATARRGRPGPRRRLSPLVEPIGL